MNHLFLTRNQYNWLATNCYDWMQLRWNEYARLWQLEGLSGVIVKGKPEEIEILRCQLPVDVE